MSRTPDRSREIPWDLDEILQRKRFGSSASRPLFQNHSRMAQKRPVKSFTHLARHCSSQDEGIPSMLQTARPLRLFCRHCSAVSGHQP